MNNHVAQAKYLPLVIENGIPLISILVNVGYYSVAFYNKNFEDSNENLSSFNVTKLKSSDDFYLFVSDFLTIQQFLQRSVNEYDLITMRFNKLSDNSLFVFENQTTEPMRYSTHLITKEIYVNTDVENATNEAKEFISSFIHWYKLNPLFDYDTEIV